MENKLSPSVSKFARFSSVGIQMGVIIALFTWLGNYLDHKTNTKTPWWTLFLSLFGVTAGLIVVIKEVIKMGKEDAEK
jgi:F0F1-type ATP synthase assembly protein I